MVISRKMGQPQLQPLLRPSPEEIHGAAPGFAYGLSFSVWRSSRIRSLARWLLASIPLRGNCKSILNAQPVPRKGVQLERQLGPQLNRAVASVACNGVGYIPESAGCICAEGLAWFIELRGIGDAEGFGPKLQVHALFNRKAPEYRSVQIKQPWPTEGPAGAIAQCCPKSVKSHWIDKGGLAKRPTTLQRLGLPICSNGDGARRHIKPRRATGAGTTNAM